MHPAVPPYGNAKWTDIPACSLTGMCLLRLKATAYSTDSVAVKILIPFALVLALAVGIPFDFIATPLCTHSLKAWLKGTVASLLFLLSLPFRLIKGACSDIDALFPVSWDRECAGAPHPMVLAMRLGGVDEGDMDRIVDRQEMRVGICGVQDLVPLITPDEFLLRYGYSDAVQSSLQENYSLIDMLRRRPLVLRNENGQLPDGLSEKIRRWDQPSEVCRREDILEMAAQSQFERSQWFNAAVYSQRWDVAEALYALGGAQGAGLWWVELNVAKRFFRRAVEQDSLEKGLNVLKSCLAADLWIEILSEYFEIYEKEKNIHLLQALLQAEEEVNLKADQDSFEYYRSRAKSIDHITFTILRIPKNRSRNLFREAIRRGYAEVVALWKARLQKIHPDLFSPQYLCYFIGEIEDGQLANKAVRRSVGDALWDDSWKRARFADGHTLLTYAVFKESEWLIDYFLSKGADTDLGCHQMIWGDWGQKKPGPLYNKTPYDLAREKGLDAIAQKIDPHRWAEDQVRKEREKQEEQRRKRQKETNQPYWDDDLGGWQYPNGSSSQAPPPPQFQWAPPPIIPQKIRDLSPETICPPALVAMSLEEIQRRVREEQPSEAEFTALLGSDQLQEKMDAYLNARLQLARTLFEMIEKLRRAREYFSKAIDSGEHFRTDVILKPLWELFDVRVGDKEDLVKKSRRIILTYHPDKYSNRFRREQPVLAHLADSVTRSLNVIKELLSEEF